MRCEQAQTEISAYVDGELSAERQQAVEAHLASCAACKMQAEDYRRIGRSLKAVAYQRAPAELAERIRLQIAQDGLSEQPSPSAAWQRYASYAATLLLVAGLSASTAWHLATTRGARSAVESEIVVAHVRSLLQESVTQISSSDRHTVKPWFIRRLDFSPPVLDLTAQGFPLKGGRLDFVGDRRVAAIVYARRQHVINLFVWPADGVAAQEPKITTARGYNVLTWNADGVTYWAASDLNISELKQFQSLLAMR